MPYALVAFKNGNVTNIKLDEFVPHDLLEHFRFLYGDSVEEAILSPESATLELRDTINEKLNELRNTCESVIVAGAPSNALGTVYIYPTAMTDQLNLSGSILFSVLPDTPNTWQAPFICADEQGNWEYRMHTKEQIQQVGKDVMTFITSCTLKHNALRELVRSLKTPAEVAQVSWEGAPT